jgi:FMN-dependent NADH-azoreductase
MSHLLYIEASPRKKRSSSIELAHTFLESYQANKKEEGIDYLDLWATPLPEFDDDIIDAKYAIMQQQAHTEAQRKSWRSVEELIKQFKSAACYLFSLPMWNFSIPYKLKHYLDVIVQPTYTFNVSSKGYEGLVTGKPAILIYSRSGIYAPGSGAEQLDLQKAYMETVLKFIGFTEMHSIIIEPTASTEGKEKAIQKAKEEAIQLATTMT